MKNIKKMKRRALALLLCFAMILNINPAIPLQAFANGQVSVTCDGDPVKSVELPQNERVQLTADRDKLGDGEYQWQILAFESIWVDIAGAKGESIELSYAMVASLLDNDEATVRCKVVNGETEVYSSEVIVTVDYDSVTEFRNNSHDSTITSSGNKESFVNASDSDAIEDEDNDEVKTPSNSSTATPSNYSNSSNIVLRTFSRLRSVSETQEICNIVINYIFEDGKQAANPWTAKVTYGSSLDQVVTSPTVVGYTPDQEEVSLSDYEAITGDITVNVIYTPDLVTYTIIHNQQNINDDGYTEVIEDRSEKKGYTEDPVGEGHENTYEGFYSLLYDATTPIAADGSTKVEIYYDRYYYLMTFDLDGGYGVEPIYARYGTKIEVESIPTKEGYTFGGYTLNGVSAEIPDTMPAENRNYKVLWIPNNSAKVSVVFWGENPNDEGYSYYKTGILNVETGTEFTYSGEDTRFLICGMTEHIHDETCLYLLTCTIAEHRHDVSCCTKSVHTHTVNCFDGVGEKNTDTYNTLGAPTNPNEGYVYQRSGMIFSFDPIIYVNGEWYQYDGNASSGTTVTPNSSCPGAHVHGDGNCICEQIAHTHDEDCYSYSCGKIAHSHDSNCYQNGSGMDSTLWTLVGSDTVTVAPDGTSIVNVYYDRTEFTLRFRKTNSNNDDYGTITDKWGADIKDRFFEICNNATTGGTYSWSKKKGGGSPWTSYIGIMPAENIIYYAHNDNSTMKAYYYFQDLNGNYNDTDMITVTAEGSGLTVTDEDRAEFEGFTHDLDASTENGSSFNNAKFYYIRNSYNLVFNNGVDEVRTESVKYEAPLSTYKDYVPTAPSIYPPESVTFAGWYQNPECTGSEFVLTEHLMPAKNLILYAKWETISFNVNIYLTNEMTDKIGDTQSVFYGNTATEPEKSVVVHPDSELYVFVGWFYLEDGVEKAFDFSIPITKNLNLYAKWGSNTLVPYTIKYAIRNEDDSITYIAADTTGNGLAGTTKTFEALAGDELNDGYKSGYFPETNSHSLTFDVLGNNEFTFYYVKLPVVPYTVRYLAVGTEEILHEEKYVADNTASVVTENFEVVVGYRPDAYQKRLVLSANEDQNVIIFWYEKDDVHAPVQVIHYFQNASGEGYSIYNSFQDLNGIIGKSYDTDVLNNAGYTYDYATANGERVTATDGKVSGTVEATGLILELYYNRNLYPYEFKFIEQGTNVVVADSETGNARYGAQVTQNAKIIPGYVCVSENAQAITIQIESGNMAEKNVRTFYYKELDVTINYVAVGPEGVTDFGSVSPETETVKVMNGTVSGSTPTAADGYQFVGWYTDAACTTPVIAAWVDAENNHITPQKTISYGDVAAPNAYEAATYYAKFERAEASLTITKRGADTVDSNQTFIFHVTGKTADGEAVSMTVSVVGNASVTIKNMPMGEYKISEDSNWSWRYTADDVTVALDKDKEVTITNTRNNTKWLDFSFSKMNRFDMKTVSSN